MIKSISVPGSLLLLGEYAVLEHGGLGLTAAPEIRTRISIRSSDKLLVQGYFGGRTVTWSPAEPDTHPLFREIYRACNRLLVAEHRTVQLSDRPYCIGIDSSDFYSPGGNKLGLGSSAAASIGLSVALLHIVGFPADTIRDECLKISLEAHRSVQNGAGSGYDVYTSLHGSYGLFTGGEHPSWHEIRIPWMPGLFIFSNTSPVSTHDAIKRYYGWKENYPKRAMKFLRDSNSAIIEFIQAPTREEAKTAFKKCRSLGIELGEEIGVPASVTPPRDMGGALFKATGAGNELGFLLSERTDMESYGETDNGMFHNIEIAKEGITWN
jgi:phosphomevalonate kinase